MAAPFPYNSIAGAPDDPAESDANKMFGQYMWVARLVNEMDLEVELDLKRTVQLKQHCRGFRLFYDRLQVHIQARSGKTVAELTAAFPLVDAGAIQGAFDYAIGRQDATAQSTIAGIIEAIFGVRKCKWATRAAMASDLASIYTTAGTVADWIEANQPETKQGWSTNVEISEGVYSDVARKITKTSGIAARLSAFRAIFAPAG